MIFFLRLSLSASSSIILCAVLEAVDAVAAAALVLADTTICSEAELIPFVGHRYEIVTYQFLLILQ